MKTNSRSISLFARACIYVYVCVCGCALAISSRRFVLFYASSFFRCWALGSRFFTLFCGDCWPLYNNIAKHAYLLSILLLLVVVLLHCFHVSILSFSLRGVFFALVEYTHTVFGIGLVLFFCPFSARFVVLLLFNYQNAHTKALTIRAIANIVFLKWPFAHL